MLGGKRSLGCFRQVVEEITMQKKTLVEQELAALNRIQDLGARLLFKGRANGKKQFIHDVITLRKAILGYDQLLKGSRENVLGDPFLYYSQRRELWDQYSKWCEENHVVRDSEAIFVWLCENELLDISKAEEQAPLKLKVINFGKGE